ncbi:MAG: GNAT family N-acetyltransferase [Burkholderiales bacterium]|nr:GNAT family N-acetyltransferase [Burkholderiales bacterium]
MPRIELQAFQPERDLSLISTWLDRPHVARCWGESGKALLELRTHNAETVALITLDEQPVGLLCWQTPSPGELNQAGLADLPSDLIDVDIMIGEPSAQGRGVGPEALRLLFERLRARGAVFVGLATALANQRAISAYAKAGMHPFRDFVELGEQYRYFTRRLIDAA